MAAPALKKIIPNNLIIPLILGVAGVVMFFSVSQANSEQYQKKNYFASTRANKVNVRSGPSSRYQIKYILNKKSIPLKVTAEFDNWNEIIDYAGDSGWVNKNLLTKKRFLIVKTPEPYIFLYKKKSLDSKKIVKIQNNVIVEFDECSKLWCKIETNDYHGWIEKNNLWGY